MYLKDQPLLKGRIVAFWLKTLVWVPMVCVSVIVTKVLFGLRSDAMLIVIHFPFSNWLSKRCISYQAPMKLEKLFQRHPSIVKKNSSDLWMSKPCIARSAPVHPDLDGLWLTIACDWKSKATKMQTSNSLMCVLQNLQLECSESQEWNRKSQKIYMDGT